MIKNIVYIAKYTIFTYVPKPILFKYFYLMYFKSQRSNFPPQHFFSGFFKK